MAPMCSDGSNHKCLGEQNYSVGGDRDCVHRGSEAAHGIQKPEAEVGVSLEFTGTQEEGNQIFILCGTGKIQTRPL